MEDGVLKRGFKKAPGYAFFVIAYLLQGMTASILVGGQSLAVWHFCQRTHAHSRVIGTYIAIVGAVWLLKPVYGWLVSLGGAGRGLHRWWLALAVVLSAVTAFATGGSPVEPQELSLVGLVPSVAFLLSVVGHNLASALLDTVADSVVYRVVPKRDRGFVETLMWGSMTVGVAVGGGTFGLYNNPYEFSQILSGFAGVILLLGAIAFVLLGRMRYVDFKETEAAEEAGRSARSWRSRTLLVAGLVVVAVISQLGKGMIEPLFHPWLSEIGGYGNAARGMLLGFSSAMNLAGVLIAGVLVIRYPRRVVVPGMLLLAAVYMAFYVMKPWWGWRPTVVLLAAATAFAEGMILIPLVLLFRNVAAEIGRSPAFLFQLFMAGLNVGRLVAPPFGGFVAGRIGLAWTFVAAAVACVLAAVLIRTALRKLLRL